MRGREVLAAAPKPLQESFARASMPCERWEQHQLVAVLERVASMMDAENLDAAPLLSEDRGAALARAVTRKRRSNGRLPVHA
jgi:hypothetical protein